MQRFRLCPALVNVASFPFSTLIFFLNRACLLYSTDPTGNRRACSSTTLRRRCTRRSKRPRSYRRVTCWYELIFLHYGPTRRDGQSILLSTVLQCSSFARCSRFYLSGARSILWCRSLMQSRTITHPRSTRLKPSANQHALPVRPAPTLLQIWPQ